jgi:hypothetical protein
VSLNTSVEVAFETSWLLSPAAGAMVTLLWNYNLVCLEPRSRSYDCFSQKLQIAFQGILNRSFAVFFKLTLPWLHWDRLFGQKCPLLIFRGTLSGKTKQTEEKRNIEMQYYLIQMNHVK